MDEAPLPELGGGGDGEYEGEAALGPAERLSRGKIAAAFTVSACRDDRRCMILKLRAP